MNEPRAAVAHDVLRATLKSQYHAALAMLHEAIERCPEQLWLSTEHRNAFWQVAYHTLYFAHLYLQRSEADFVPWEQHQSDVQHPDGIPGRADPTSKLPLIPSPYTKPQVLAYRRRCDDMVDPCVDRMDLNDPSSGFSWYRMSKLEHQVVGIRHIEHHTAQLADRLRAAADIGVRWIGSR